MAEAAVLAPSEPGAPQPRRRRAGRNLPLAIMTGLGAGAAFSASLYLGQVAFLVFLLVVAVLGLVELLRVLRARSARPAAPVVLASAGVLILGAWWQGIAALSFGMLLVLLAASVWYLFDPSRADVTRNLAATVFAALYVPFCTAHLALVAAALPSWQGAVMGYALIVVAYDVAAYTAGVTVGRHLLAPRVSPHKSWEGAIGGSLACLAVGGLVLPLWHPWTVASGLTLAALACIVAPLGDLVESMLKRDLAVKDMGSMLPGHGGVLDRIDALLLMAPVLYYVLALYGMVPR